MIDKIVCIVIFLSMSSGIALYNWSNNDYSFDTKESYRMTVLDKKRTVINKKAYYSLVLENKENQIKLEIPIDSKSYVIVRKNKSVIMGLSKLDLNPSRYDVLVYHNGPKIARVVSIVFFTIGILGILAIIIDGLILIYQHRDSKILEEK